MAWAVELRGVSKSFVLRHNRASHIKVRLIGVFEPRYREQLESFWALRGIDLRIRRRGVRRPDRAQRLGQEHAAPDPREYLPPTEGEAVVRGRVAPMIELGVGFQPDLTGRRTST